MKLKDFVSKTIKSIDDSSINVQIITFTDGSVCSLYADCGNDVFSIPHFYVEKTESTIK